jgi:hypothetical protein
MNSIVLPSRYPVALCNTSKKFLATIYSQYTEVQPPLKDIKLTPNDRAVIHTVPVEDTRENGYCDALFFRAYVFITFSDGRKEIFNTRQHDALDMAVPNVNFRYFKDGTNCIRLPAQFLTISTWASVLQVKG